MRLEQTRRNGHKAAIREENEKAILAAAEEVFAEYGFAGATTSRIAERAGLPKANLHYYSRPRKASIAGSSTTSLPCGWKRPARSTTATIRWRR